MLTSQQVYSGRFLSALPVLLLAALYLVNREYMMEFFREENRLVGSIALGIAVLLILAGYFVMNKIADIEV